MTKDSLVHAIVKITCKGTVGSGFLLKGGFVVTAYHVVEPGNPQFFTCNEEFQFKQKVDVEPQPVGMFNRKEGDLAVYRILNEAEYVGRYLELAPENQIFHGKSFHTFGFPEGNRINGNPYNSAKLDDTASANDHGIKKLTLADPGNVSKGYSGGPVYIPGYGVVGIITQIWDGISIGLPSSIIAAHFPDLAPEERFFPVESLGKYRCLVVHHQPNSQALVFFEEEVGYLLSSDPDLKERLFLQRYHLQQETVDLQRAAAEADCICLWLDGAADISHYKQDAWLKDHTVLFFNFGLKDANKLEDLLGHFNKPACFPYDDENLKVLPGFHYFEKVLDLYRDKSSDAYRLFFHHLQNEFLNQHAVLTNLFLKFDFTAAREAIKKACRTHERFIFHCLEGTVACGLKVLASHGIELIKTQSQKDSPENVQWKMLDCELDPVISLDELLLKFDLRPENWFTDDGIKVLILQNFVTPELNGDLVQKRMTLINELISYCSNLEMPPQWQGAFHFFIINSAALSYRLAQKLHKKKNCYLGTAEIVNLNADPDPLKSLQDDLKSKEVPHRLQKLVIEKLPKTDECPYVGSFLLEICDRLNARHIYFNELIRI